MKRPSRRLPRLSLAVALASAAAAGASAQTTAGTSGPFAANFVGAGLVALSFPTTPFAPGKWDISVSPAYVKAKTFNTTGDMQDYKQVDAYGAAGSVVWGVADHFALGFTGLGFNGKGKYHVPTGSGASFSSGAYDMKTSGFIAAASLIFDPFTGDGFRLPLMAGVNYESMRDESTGVLDGSGNSLGALGNRLDSPGVQFGLSPQFNTGPLRWEPFALVYFPLSHEKQTQNGTVFDSSIHSDTGGPQPGINVVFRPWNLSFFYALGVNKAKGTHVFSLRLAKSFGGAPAS
ncbi:MAG: hypothetical protein KGL53_11050 [Elusimicrobia bacterium]|nr:hypothetical protein [Elusimicrobiota bacterium]